MVEDYFAQLGALTAAMHNQASAWRPPPGFTRHALDRDGLMGEAPHWGPFWEHRSLSPAERRLLLDARAHMREKLGRLSRDPSVYSLIHADMHPGNILVDGDRLTVIDFDDAGFGWHAVRHRRRAHLLPEQAERAGDRARLPRRLSRHPAGRPTRRWR